MSLHPFKAINGDGNHATAHYLLAAWKKNLGHKKTQLALSVRAGLEVKK